MSQLKGNGYVITSYYYVAGEPDDSNLAIVGILPTYKEANELMQSEANLMANDLNQNYLETADDDDDYQPIPYTSKPTKIGGTFIVSRGDDTDGRFEIEHYEDVCIYEIHNFNNNTYPKATPRIKKLID